MQPLPAPTYLPTMSTTSPPSAIRPQHVARAVEPATGIMLQIRKDSNVAPPSAAAAQANQPTWKSSTTDPTASSKKNQENLSSMPATQPANSLQAQPHAAGVINSP